MTRVLSVTGLLLMLVMSAAVVHGRNDNSAHTRIISIRWVSEPDLPGEGGRGSTIVHAECSVKVAENGDFAYFSGGEAHVSGRSNRIEFGLRINGHVTESQSGEWSVDVVMSHDRRVLKEEVSKSIVIAGRSIRFVGAVSTNEEQTCFADGSERLEIHIDDK